MANESIFTKKSLDKVNSPEQLNDYIKTSNPSAWFVVIAAIVLLGALIVWGAFGSLDSTVKVGGVATGDSMVCYVADASAIAIGDSVTVGELTGEVVAVSEKPISLAQATEQVGGDEYTLYCLALGDWSYVVEIKLDGKTADGFATAEIVTDSTRPLSFIWE